MAETGLYYTNLAPSAVSASLSSGLVATSVPTVFTTQYSDTKGYADIYRCQLQLSVGSAGADSVVVVYDRNVNKVYLKNDANTAWIPGSAPGTSTTLRNSQCITNLAGMTVTPSGTNDLLIDRNITLKPTQTGKKLYERLYCQDQQLLNSGWQVKGFVTAD